MPKKDLVLLLNGGHFFKFVVNSFLQKYSVIYG